MINVLQIIDGKTFGGIANLMYEVEKHMGNNIKFEFLSATNIYDKWNNLGVCRETLKGKLIYDYRLYKFFKRNKYDIVHINSGVFLFTFQVVIVCKVAGIKKIICHSHSTPNISGLKSILIKILNPLYRKMIDVKLTCSKKAAKSLFTKEDDVVIVKNGIDVQKYKYDENIRYKYRKILNLEKKVVYGHVGNFEKEKNHEFLIDVFFEIQKKQNSMLLLIGNGKLENLIKEKVRQLNIEDKVIFLGFRKDICNLMNAMDFFLFPSLREGLPLSLIEAQTSGLPVFVSSGVTDEANILNYHKIESNDCVIWADYVLNAKVCNRRDAYKETLKKGYDIKETAKKLEKIYEGLSK